MGGNYLRNAKRTKPYTDIITLVNISSLSKYSINLRSFGHRRAGAHQTILTHGVTGFAIAAAWSYTQCMPVSSNACRRPGLSI
jgi:hypothetical protein